MPQCIRRNNFIFVCCILFVLVSYLVLSQNELRLVKPDIRVANVIEQSEVLLTASDSRINSSFFFKQLTEIFKVKIRRFWLNIRMHFTQSDNLPFFFGLDMVIALFFIFYQTSRKNSGIDAFYLIRFNHC